MASESSVSTSVLDGVPRLEDQDVRPGERWIFSAGCNVAPGETDTARIDVEVPDLQALLSAGARVAMLSHQGDEKAGTAVGHEHVAARLQQVLGRPVLYEATPEDADVVLRASAPGTLVVVGNTRMNAGETANDPALVRRYARLGTRAAVGGFSKAHRRHASNVGILDLVPGCAARSLVSEVTDLAPWTGRVAAESLAVLGGTKSEKTLLGLAGLADFYDVLVPGGAVLTAVLAAQGVEIGASVRSERFDECVAVAEQVLRDAGERIHVPTQVVVASPHPDGTASAELVPTSAGVPAGASIVDFVPEPWLVDHLGRLGRTGGRALLAGTPSLYLRGHDTALRVLLPALAQPTMTTILLGGDTTQELPWSGRASTGGGSALFLLARGSLPVLDALRQGGTTA